MNKKNIIIIFFAICLFSTQSIFSQQNDGIWVKIQKIKLDKLVKRLNLDESTESVFREKYVSFSENMRELNKKRARYYLIMVANIETGDGLDTLVDCVVNIDNEINQRRTEFAKDLKTILTPKQLAITIVFERKFNNQLKKLINEYTRKKKLDNN